MWAHLWGVVPLVSNMTALRLHVQHVCRSFHENMLTTTSVCLALLPVFYWTGFDISVKVKFHYYNFFYKPASIIVGITFASCMMNCISKERGNAGFLFCSCVITNVRTFCEVTADGWRGKKKPHTLARVDYAVLNISDLFGTIMSPPAGGNQWCDSSASGQKCCKLPATKRKVSHLRESLQGNVTKWQQVECTFPVWDVGTKPALFFQKVSQGFV